MVNQSWSKEVLRERLLKRYPDGKYIGIPLSPIERYACKKFYNDVNSAFSDMGIIHRKSKEGGVLRLTNKNSIERKNISKINNGLNESESSYINDIRKKHFLDMIIVLICIYIKLVIPDILRLKRSMN